MDGYVRRQFPDRLKNIPSKTLIYSAEGCEAAQAQLYYTQKFIDPLSRL